MKRLRLGAAILNQTPLDWEGNTHRIVEAIQLARQQNVHVLCLPELCITGYGCEDAFHSMNTGRDDRVRRVAGIFNKRRLQHSLRRLERTNCGICGETTPGRRWSAL